MDRDMTTRRLEALAHDGRLSVLRLLIAVGGDGCPAGEIGRALCLPSNTLSARLAALTRAGLTDRRRSGRQVIYRARPEALSEVVIHLLADVALGRAEVATPVLDAIRKTARSPGKA